MAWVVGVPNNPTGCSSDSTFKGMWGGRELQEGVAGGYYLAKATLPTGGMWAITNLGAEVIKIKNSRSVPTIENYKCYEERLGKTYFEKTKALILAKD